MLYNISHGINKLEDYRLLQARFQTHISEAERSSYEQETHFFFRTKTVIAHNSDQLHDLHVPIARIDAIHSDKTAKSASADAADGLQPSILVALGARVRIPRNLWQEAGLVNGSTGTIRDIIFPANSKPPDMSLAIIIELDATYKGPPWGF